MLLRNKIITCNDLSKFPNFPGCCSSCHEDYNEHGYDLCGDNENWDICCIVCNWLIENGINPYESPQLNWEAKIHSGEKNENL